MPKSYARTTLGIWQRVRELMTLYRFHDVDTQEQVRFFIANMEAHQRSIESLLGEPLRDKTILEIGPGQILKNARFFGAKNRVVAIDLDQIIVDWNVANWWAMFYKNGALRFVKTLARKLLGFDQRFLAELARQMPSTSEARIEVLQRDASESGLVSNSFDCAISFSVFEHLREPRLVMREIFRLLRPGGATLHIVHCFTSDSGAHDPRSFFVERSDLPYWAHLRPSTRHLVSGNSFVNRLSIVEWKTIIFEEFPGAEIVELSQSDIPRLAKELKTLRATGELADYSDEELLTVCLKVSWVKPIDASDAMRSDLSRSPAH